MLFDEAIKPISKHSKRILISILSIVITALVLLAFMYGGTYTVFVWVAGFPLTLVLLSLTFGKASKDKGIMSSFTLFSVGGLIGISSIVAIFYGNFTASIGLTLSILILHLGWQRRK
ncbi:hypothetical protein [Sessilibacter corallicola]|uniref:hypothetical protein n=1 Tax=Sessilibacter corallicola TaxID=2904075 RepID=UPI001E2B316E|nr:hypothetical protein [Sessilibacter corallicola]MCE2027683.1 hypothetical protein [Sessilibacter corallicola]